MMPNPNRTKTIKQQNKRNGRDLFRPFFIYQVVTENLYKKPLPEIQTKSHRRGIRWLKYLNNNMQGVNTYRWMNELAV